MRFARQERRNTPRYPAVRYTALVQRDNLLGKCRSLREAAVRDFNRKGMSFFSERRLQENDKVVLQIHSVSEHIRGILARVRHVRKQPDGYCIGVEFVRNPLSFNRVQGAEIDVLQGVEKLILSQLT